MTRLLRGAASRWVACALLFFIVPGAEEIVGDALHIVMDGHTFHDEGHEEPDHCCSGAFHFCGCHARSPAVPVLVARGVFAALPAALREIDPPIVIGSPREGHARRIIRPPAA